MSSTSDENNEYFEEEKYVMAPEDKKEVNEYISKRKYVRHQPKKPQTEAQKKAFEKARATLLENKAKKNVAQLRKSAPVTVREKNPTIKQSPKIAAPKKEPKQNKTHIEPVYDDEYEDDASENQFMITDNNKKNYIVRPVVRRLAPVQPSIIAKRRRPINKNNIETSVDNKKLDGIVETQINNMEEYQYKKAHPKYTNIHRHTNIHDHTDIIRQTPQQPQKINRRNLTLLDLEYM